MSRKVFIVAEIGLNHNGDLKLAKELIKAAAGAGVDAVKFQVFIPEEYVSPKIPVVSMKGGSSSGFQIDLYRKFVFSEEEYTCLANLAKKNKIDFFGTAFSKNAADILERLGVNYYKLASCDITNIPLIRYLASKGKPLIISTGMASLQEIDEAVKSVKDFGNQGLSLLHCISDYPPADGDINLGVIQLLKERYSLPVGFSDHTTDELASLGAVVMGAEIIEKHFTLSRGLEGVDHYFSMEPPQMKEMVKKIRRLKKMMGGSELVVTESEKKMRHLARRGIKSKSFIKKGEIITEEMLAIARPEDGIAPAELGNLIGKMAKIDIEPWTPLKYEMLTFF